MALRFSETSTFSKTARENFKELTLLEPQIEELSNCLAGIDSENDHAIESELMFLEENMAERVAITIVFTAIAIESYIYDFAARHFSDNFVQNYIT